jgi:hypothetical protein
MNKSLNKCKKQQNDVIYTPEALARDCIASVPIQEGDTILDPFLGGGVFFDNYPPNNPRDWCEIEKGRDFFEYDKNVDWIISNPPFSRLNDVLDKCAEVSNKGFGLTILCTALTVRRINRMKEKGFIISRIMYFKVCSWFGFPSFFVLFERGGTLAFSVEPKVY